MLKKNDIVKLNIVDLTTEGEGIGKVDGFPLFVKDTVIGDEILACVTKLKKTYGYGHLQQILVPSPDRVESRCPIAKICGGCQLQAMSYEAQLRFKQQKVQNNLQRLGGLANIPMQPIIGMENPWHYRNKAIVAVGPDASGKLVAGFYAARSHNIIQCDDCALQPEEFSEIIQEKLSDDMTHMLLRKGFHTNQLMAYGVENHENNAVLSGKLTHIYGQETIEDSIGDLKFNISPRSFFQVNPIQVEKLYGKALEFAQLQGNEIVWDLYCGIGTISLTFAKHAAYVHGVEIIEDAILDARENAKNNNIENVSFYVGKAEDLAPTLPTPDIIVVDPPRKGCDEKLIETILSVAPPKVVYVSCDSATLARDFKLLSDKYDVKLVQPVDMFPQTVHVETVLLMSKR